MNPTHFSWLGASEREDNTPYLPEDRRGYDVSVRPAEAVDESPGAYILFTSTIPSPENAFMMPLSDLGNPMTEGDWIAVVRDVDTEGRASDWSEGYNFSWVISAPKSPTGLIVS